MLTGRVPMFVLLAVVVAGCSAASAPAEDFPTFWSAFRAAALADKVDQLASLARFPVEVRGPNDTDPVVTQGREAFAETFTQVLKQDSGARPEPESVRQFLERTPEVGQGDVEPDGRAARVGDFVFERIGDRWLLVRVYLDNGQ